MIGLGLKSTFRLYGQDMSVPLGIEYDSIYDRFYVANFTGGTSIGNVQVYSSDWVLIETIPDIISPSCLSFDSNTRKMYGTSGGLVGYLFTVDIDDLTLTKNVIDGFNTPRGVLVEYNNDRIFICDMTNSRIGLFKLSDLSFIQYITTGLTTPSFIDYDPFNDKYWVSCYTDNSVKKLNSSTFAVENTYTGFSQAYGLRVDKNIANRMIIANTTSGILEVFNTNSGSSIGGIRGFGAPRNVLFINNTVLTGTSTSQKVISIEKPY